jgi:hypothetical protein
MIIRTASFLASALFCLVTSAQASPITYDFSGTLAQPYKGSSLFSGSFSFESSTSGYSGSSLVSGYAGASASLTIGGQTYQFQNVTTDSGSSQTPNVWYQFDHNTSTGDAFTLLANNGVSTGAAASPGATMTIHLYDPTGTALLPTGSTLPSLDLNHFSIRQLSFSSASTSSGMLGTITTLQAVPEPSVLAFVTLVGLGLFLRRGASYRNARTSQADLLG